MRHCYFLLFLVLYLSACSSSPAERLSREIDHLDSDDKRRAFLEQVFALDQQCRKEADSLAQQFGYGSTEYLRADRQMDTIDSLNLLKIERYLAVHGYPDKKKLGEIAALTPWAVIHHAGTYSDRERNIPILLRAWQEGHIDDGELSLFLHRMYQMKTGTSFRMEGVFRERDYLDSLMKRLDMNFLSR